MKVWLIHQESYGEVSVYSEDTDIMNTATVVSELEYLVGGYQEEADEFAADISRMKNTGRGTASIEERIRVELVEVSTS